MSSNVNPYMQNNSAKSGDGIGDIRKIIRLILKNWYLFVIFVVLSLSVVWTYHRYTLPLYRSSVTMLFKINPERDFSRSVITEGFGLSSEMKSFENQRFIIRSHAMALRAINRLDFGVAYFVKGRVKDTELYSNLPFKIEFDSLHPQLLNVPIDISFLDDKKIRVSVTTEGGSTHSFAESRDVGYSGPLQFKKTISINEEIIHPAFSFKIVANGNGRIPTKGEYYITFNSHNRLASRYRSSLNVTPYGESASIIFISATGHQPQKLVRFVQTISEEIVVNNLERKNDMANRSISFIQHQLSVVEDTLSVIQQKIIQFRQQHGFVMPTEMSQRLSNDFFEETRRVRELDSQYSYLQLISDRLQSDTLDEDDFLLPAFSDNLSSLLSSLITEHLILLKENQLITSQSGSKNPYQYELEKKIAHSRNSLLAGINKQMENIELKKSELINYKGKISNEISKLPELEKEYLALERTHKLNDAIYTFLLQKASENQIAKASNVPDNEVLDQATVSGPISPNKRNNYSKGVLVGLIIPVVFIGLKEILNKKVRTKEELENLRFDLPILGTILHNEDKSERVVFDFQNTLIGESFRSLRARLIFMMKQDESVILTITSTNTGEGKTFCSVNLASVFALSGKKTILVGFDLRKPRIAKIFDISSRIGLSSYLSDQNSLEEISFVTMNENLTVIPGGEIPPNPSELVSSEYTSKLFNELKKNYDVIIVDTPPVGLVSDARILMDIADCNLYVVREGVTVKEHLTQTVSNLLEQNVGCLGFIMNDVTSISKGYGYYASGYFADETNN